MQVLKAIEEVKMSWVTTFFVVLFFTFLFSLVMVRQKIPSLPLLSLVSDAVVIPAGLIDFCLFIAIVITVLVTLLIYVR